MMMTMKASFDVGQTHQKQISLVLLYFDYYYEYYYY